MLVVDIIYRLFLLIQCVCLSGDVESGFGSDGCVFACVQMCVSSICCWVAV